MSYALPPDLVVVFGVRSVISIIGLLGIAIGYWITEKEWDESDLEANNLENYIGNALKSVFDWKPQMSPADADVEAKNNYRAATDTPANANQQATTGDDDDDGKGEIAHKVMLVGFVLWAISFFFHPEGNFRIYTSYFWNVWSFFVVLVIGALVAFQIRRCTVDRDFEMKKSSVFILLGAMALLAVTVFMDDDLMAPWYYSVIGVVLLAAGNYILWRIRKMGKKWDIEGRSNQEITLPNTATPFLVLGLFFLWVGTNAIDMAGQDDAYLPIYLNYGAWVALIASYLIIIPSLMCLDYAFDEGSEPKGEGLDGSAMHKATDGLASTTYLEPVTQQLENPFVFMFGWCLFGLCSFMPFGGGFTMQKLFSLIAAVAVGYVYGKHVLPSYWQGNAAEYQKSIYAYYGLLFVLAAFIGIRGGVALWLALVGVATIIVGQYLDMSERKRGTWWMQDMGSNPHKLTIFVTGQPIYLFGWICLCLAMSIPM